jgi:hypothetical protein
MAVIAANDLRAGTASLPIAREPFDHQRLI